MYQGLEPPQDFSHGVSTATKNTSKQIQNPAKKKPSPEKIKRPILLPGYEYSDDSSQSEDDESDSNSGELRGKPKLGK